MSPMLWTVENHNNNGNVNVYFNAEATGFNQQNVAADYYRRFRWPAQSHQDPLTLQVSPRMPKKTSLNRDRDCTSTLTKNPNVKLTH